MSLLVVVALLSLARGFAAQEPCRLERAVAPDYGGVMLGMNLEELRRMFPGSDELQKGPGAEAVAASKPFVASLGMLELGVRKEEFKGVEELVLTFIGGTLQRIDVRFHQPVPWSAINDFSEHASKRLAVPADAWDAPSADSSKQSRVLDCRGFSVVVRMDKGGPSTLSIVDTGATKAEAPASNSSPTPAKRRPSHRKSKV
jgi:hypothetical protein